MADRGRPHRPPATAPPPDPTSAPVVAARALESAAARPLPPQPWSPLARAGAHREPLRGRPGRHRRGRGPAGFPGSTAIATAVASCVLLTVLALTGVAVPALLLAGALLAVLAGLGTPLLRLSGVPVPDPVARTVLTVTVGLVPLLGLALLLEAADASRRTSVLAVDGLVVAAAVATRLTAGWGPPPPGRREGRRPAGLSPAVARLVRPALPVLLPVTAALLLAHPVAGSSPGTVTAVVLAAVLLTLGALSLRRPSHRGRTAVLVHAVGWTLLMAVAHTHPAPSGRGGGDRGAEALGRFAVGLGALPVETVLHVVLPAVAALLPVLVWLVAERVVGPRRAPLVLTLFLAFPVWVGPLARLLAVDLALVPLTAVLLVSVTGLGTGVGARRRQGLTLVLAVAAGVMQTGTAALFAVQCLLVALTALAVRRRAREGGTPGPRTFTVPWSVALAVLLWVWTVPVSGRGPELTALLGHLRPTVRLTDPPPLWWLWPLAVLVGLVALAAGRARPPVRHPEFLLSIVAAAVVALVVLVVPTVGDRTVLASCRAVLPVLAVPALLGLGAVVDLVGSWAGRLTDVVGRRRAPQTWTPVRPRHRGRPSRLLRTALVPLLVFSVSTGLLSPPGAPDPLAGSVAVQAD